jgi:hypothetical protein
MSTNKHLLLKVLALRYHKDQTEAFLKPLPQSLKDELANINMGAIDPKDLFPKPDKELASLHYSWLIPVIEKIPKSLRGIYLSSLPLPLRKGITGLQDIGSSKAQVPARLRSYFQRRMWKQIKDPKILPKSLLQKSPLEPLLHIDKRLLVELVDFLGIHDLAEKIKYIVDKAKLNAIYRCLSPGKLKFLQYCLKHSERISFTDLDLNRWDGECSKLKMLLHRKGLIRLSKALSGSSIEFLWHFSHKLDIGRAAFLEKNILPTAQQPHTGILIDQVLNIVNMMNQKRS